MTKTKVYLYVFLVIMLVINTLTSFLFVYSSIYDTQMRGIKEEYYPIHSLIISFNLPWIFIFILFIIILLTFLMLLVLGPILLGTVNYIDKKSKAVILFEPIIYLISIIFFMVIYFIILFNMYSYFTAWSL